MNITSLQIIKGENGVFSMIPNGISAYETFNSGNRGTAIGDFLYIKSDTGAITFKDVAYNVISYFEDGVETTFNSTKEAFEFLEGVGFFGNDSTGGGATVFTELDDTPNSYAGSAGYSVVVNASATGLEFKLIPIINSIFDLVPGGTPGQVLKINSDGDAEWVDSGFTVNQNNIGKTIGLPSQSTPPSILDVVNKMNARNTVINETDTPVILTVRMFGTQSMTYKYLFLPGRGTWGLSGDTVTGTMIEFIGSYHTTVQDIDPAQIQNIDPVIDGDYITRVNSGTYVFDWSDSGTVVDGNMKSYYISYTQDDILYILLFIGTPGIYGDGTPPLTEDDFVPITNSGIDPEVPLVTGVKGDAETVFRTGNVNITPDNLGIGSVFLPQGNWDASVGTFPTTGSSGQPIRRGYVYNVSVAGTMGGKVYDIGDNFYSNVSNPGQTPSNWSKFEANTDQATDTVRGTATLFQVTGTNTLGAMSQKATTDALALKANDADVLHKTGNEIKTGNLNVNGILSVNEPSPIVALQANWNSTTLPTAYVRNPNTTPGNSRGGLFEAGTNSSDYSAMFRNSAGVELFTVRGDGQAIIINTPTTNNSAVRLIDLNTKISKTGVLLTSSDDLYSLTEAGFYYWNASSPNGALTDFGSAVVAYHPGTNTKYLTQYDKNGSVYHRYIDPTLLITAVKRYIFYGEVRTNTNNGTPYTSSFTIPSNFGGNGEFLAFVNATSAPVTVTLPAHTAMPGNKIRVVKIDSSANAVTITGVGGVNISGTATVVLANQYERAQIEASSTQYYLTN